MQDMLKTCNLYHMSSSTNGKCVHMKRTKDFNLFHCKQIQIISEHNIKCLKHFIEQYDFCLNFWYEFSLFIFKLISSSLLLLSQHFRHCTLWPSSDVCQSGEFSGNFKLNPLFNPRGQIVLVPLSMLDAVETRPAITEQF